MNCMKCMNCMNCMKCMKCINCMKCICRFLRVDVSTSTCICKGTTLIPTLTPLFQAAILFLFIVFSCCRLKILLERIKIKFMTKLINYLFKDII